MEIWDVKKGEENGIFDPNLTYEITGYKPIDYERGLDFNPLWFTESSRKFIETGSYCDYVYGSKPYADFWNEEYRRCINGYTINGYTLTGDHYFFLNYYRLLNLSNVKFAGAGREESFPLFFTEQYKYFHYLEIARRTNMNACLMKARGVGFSEINASTASRLFNVIKDSNTIIACQAKTKLDFTLAKVWKNLAFLDGNTNRGMTKLKQVINRNDCKKSSHYIKVNGQEVETGFGSMITGITADTPDKIRGSRTELLIYEEGGCHIKGTKVIMFNGSLKNVEDIKIGDLLMGKDNTPRKVLELHRGKDMMYKITPVNGDVQIVNSNHIIYGLDITNNEFQIKACEYYLNQDKFKGYYLIKSEISKLPKEKLITTFKIEKYGIDKYYGFTVDIDNLFLLKDFTITHNSWSNSKKAFEQGEALVNIQGTKLGIKIIGGTGGDSGEKLSGLRDIYYHPEAYDVLGYKHNWTEDEQYVITGFFIPAHAMLNKDGYVDHRGFVDFNKAKKYYIKERDKKISDPEALMIYSAEYCMNAEEAFALEGTNQFNKILLSEQLSEIKIKRNCPNIETGFLDYVYSGRERTRETVTGFKWIPHKQGKLKILEHPVWTENQSEPINNLYIVGIDSIDMGQRDTSASTKDASDFCLVVKKRAFGMQDPMIVAIYKDRPDNIREAYMLAVRVAEYYNAKINLEATRISLLSWARDNNYLHLFMKRPRATMQNIKNGRSTQYGTPATETVIKHQLNLIADFITDYSHTIWFEEVLDELIRYNYENKRVFDIVAALGMVEIGDEELRHINPKTVETQENTLNNKIGYYTDMNGYKRFGVIPNSQKKTIIVTDNNFKTRMTSDPYYHENR